MSAVDLRRALIFAASAIATAIGLTGCQSNSSPASAESTAVAQCLTELDRRGKSVFDESTDRIYVFAVPGETDLWFAYGEIGWFGVSNYRHHKHWFCSVRDMPSKGSSGEVKVLERFEDLPSAIPPDFEGVPDNHQSRDVRVLLYLREGDRFFFKRERRLDSIEEELGWTQDKDETASGEDIGK